MTPNQLNRLQKSLAGLLDVQELLFSHPRVQEGEENIGYKSHLVMNIQLTFFFTLYGCKIVSSLLSNYTVDVVHAHITFLN